MKTKFDTSDRYNTNNVSTYKIIALIIYTPKCDNFFLLHNKIQFGSWWWGGTRSYDWKFEEKKMEKVHTLRSA